MTGSVELCQGGTVFVAPFQGILCFLCFCFFQQTYTLYVCRRYIEIVEEEQFNRNLDFLTFASGFSAFFFRWVRLYDTIPTVVMASSPSYIATEYKLPTETVTKYLEKITPYVDWVPVLLFIPPCIAVQKTIDGPFQEVTKEEYEKYVKENKDARRVLFTVTEGMRSNPRGDGSLNENKEKKELDPTDVAFIRGELRAFSLELYGLHKHGGFYGHFKPDLEEVINLLATQWPVQLLAGTQRIYVTTVTWPSDKTDECFDTKTWRYRAKTTATVVPFPPVPAALPISLSSMGLPGGAPTS